MSRAEFVVAMAIAIACGGYVGCAIDRYVRRRDAAPRPVNQRQLKALNPVRIEDVFWVDREGDHDPPV